MVLSVEYFRNNKCNIEMKEQSVRTTFIPQDIQCFWCNGRMKSGLVHLGSSIEDVTYFCESCGAVSHFAVCDKRRIKSIEVTYDLHKEECV